MLPDDGDDDDDDDDLTLQSKICLVSHIATVVFHLINCFLRTIVQNN